MMMEEGEEALRMLVEAKYDLAHLPRLPSPCAAMDLVQELGGIQLCSNPNCTNLDGESEAQLLKHEVCQGCKRAAYCSTVCKTEHEHWIFHGGHKD